MLFSARRLCAGSAITTCLSHPDGHPAPPITRAPQRRFPGVKTEVPAVGRKLGCGNFVRVNWMNMNGRAIHFGVLCPPTFSHVAGAVSLSRELQKRGHRVTFFNIADLEDLVVRQGVGFSPIGLQDHPAGSLPVFVRKMGQLKGLAALRFGIKTVVGEAEMILRDAPAAMRKGGISALIVDQGEIAGSTVAEHLNLPFATICNAVPGHRDPNVPPAITPWNFGSGSLARLRNRLAYRVGMLALTSLMKVVNRYRSGWGMQTLDDFQQTFSPLMQVSQLTADFDFPNQALPQHFNYIGLFEKESPPEIDFPFDRLNGKPLVYTAMGTVLTDMNSVYSRIAEACSGLDVQLVITLGSKDKEVPADLRNLPASPLVVAFAPQTVLLKRAAVTICHGGINTVLESLRCGVPVISIPIVTDSPGTSARLERSGAGVSIPIGRLDSARLRGLLQRLLQEPGYRERATALGESIAKAGGSSRAADLIVNALAPAIPS